MLTTWPPKPSRWVGYVSRIGEGGGGQERALVEKTEEMRPLGKPGGRRENIIKMDLQKVGSGGRMEWFDKAQSWARWRALVNMAMKLRVP